MSLKSKKKQGKKLGNPTAANDYFEVNKIIRAQTQINLANLRELSLSFKNIYKIQYLNCLDRLQKLQLDNNIIEKIQNLDHLTTLKWLDLSFNSIKVIEGLDKLVNLTDLSLFNNQINKMDGLSNCIKLNVLSIGNNKIETYDEIIQYLGKTPEKKCKLRHLEVLNIMGNPFTEKDKEDWEAHFIFGLPNIKYLNYMYIDDAQRNKYASANDDKFKTQDTIAYLNQLRGDEEREKAQKQQRRKKQLAKMHLIDSLHEQLVLHDEDIRKLVKIKSVQEQTSKFIQKVKEIVETIQKKIMQINDKKLKEIHKFELAIQEREKSAEKDTISFIKEFQHTLKIQLRRIQNKESPDWRQDIQTLINDTEVLKKSLLATEVELLQDVQSFFSNFQRNILEDIYKQMERVISGANDQGGFKKIGQESKEYHAKIDKYCKEEAQRIANQNNSGNPAPQQENQLDQLFDTRDNLSAALMSIKERLVQKNQRIQNKMSEEINMKDKKNYTQLFKRRQFDRKCKNVNNIHDTIKNYREKLSQMLRKSEDS